MAEGVLDGCRGSAKTVGALEAGVAATTDGALDEGRTSDLIEVALETGLGGSPITEGARDAGRDSATTVAAREGALGSGATDALDEGRGTGIGTGEGDGPRGGSGTTWDLGRGRLSACRVICDSVEMVPVSSVSDP
jgi:hypothetical protein